MKSMKHAVVLFMSFFAVILTMNAQDPFLQDGNESTEARARTLTEAYQPELVMTGTQTRLFERKVEEFLIRGDQIKSMDVSIGDRMHLLTQLSQQETEEMTNILTRPQIRRYTKVKNEIQPMAMVVDSVNTEKN